MTQEPPATRPRSPPIRFERLAPPGPPVELLVEASFACLLEREPRESILRAFDLAVISRYFPEYEAEIRKRLGA